MLEIIGHMSLKKPLGVMGEDPDADDVTLGVVGLARPVGGLLAHLYDVLGVDEKGHLLDHGGRRYVEGAGRLREAAELRYLYERVELMVVHERPCLDGALRIHYIAITRGF